MQHSWQVGGQRFEPAQYYPQETQTATFRQPEESVTGLLQQGEKRLTAYFFIYRQPAYTQTSWKYELKQNGILRTNRHQLSKDISGTPPQPPMPHGYQSPRQGESHNGSEWYLHSERDIQKAHKYHGITDEEIVNHIDTITTER